MPRTEKGRCIPGEARIDFATVGPSTIWRRLTPLAEIQSIELSGIASSTVPVRSLAVTAYFVVLPQHPLPIRLFIRCER